MFFNALFFAGLILIASVGGKAVLVMLSSQPLVGPLVAWYLGFIGPLGDGLSAYLIYGAMFVQLLLMVVLPLVYGPSLTMKAVAWCRTFRQVPSS